jgi:hypothetical protein
MSCFPNSFFIENDSHDKSSVVASEVTADDDTSVGGDTSVDGDTGCGGGGKNTVGGLFHFHKKIVSCHEWEVNIPRSKPVFDLKQIMEAYYHGDDGYGDKPASCDNLPPVLLITTRESSNHRRHCHTMADDGTQAAAAATSSSLDPQRRRRSNLKFYNHHHESDTSGGGSTTTTTTTYEVVIVSLLDIYSHVQYASTKRYSQVYLEQVGDSGVSGDDDILSFMAPPSCLSHLKGRTIITCHFNAINDTRSSGCSSKGDEVEVEAQRRGPKDMSSYIFSNNVQGGVPVAVAHMLQCCGFPFVSAACVDEK